MQIILVGNPPRQYEEYGLFLCESGTAKECSVASTGAEVLESLSRGVGDAVVCDECLSDMPGTALFAKVRERFTVPVVFLSGRQAALDAYEVMNPLSDCVLEKGADGRVLPQALAQAVSLLVALAREREERNRDQAALGLLYDQSPQGYQSLDRAGRFLTVNKAWLETLGYERDEVVGKWFGDFLLPEYTETFQNNFPRFKRQGSIRGVEFGMRHKDGHAVHVFYDGNIAYDTHGRMVCTHCVMHDITPYREMQERLAVFMSSSSEGFAVIGQDLSILECNDALARLVGETRESIISLSLWDLFPDDAARLQVHLKEVIHSGEPVFAHERVVHPLVGPFSVEVRAFKLGSAVGIIVHEAAPCSSPGTDDISLFAHAVSHDVRGPLSVIQGYADLLRDETDSPYLDKIIHKSADIASYLRQSVELVDAGKPVAGYASVDVALTVEDVAAELSFDLPVSIEAPVKVRADPKRFRQCISYLLDNVRVHAGATHAWVTVSEEDGRVVVAVRDDGRGIPEAYAGKIFDRGFSTLRGSKGLGLPIVKRTVEAHGGSVEIQTPPEGGTVVLLSFPAEGYGMTGREERPASGPTR
jgi:PAS domain S-box-containing protein